MFTGIIEEIGTISAFGPTSLSVSADLVLTDLHVGDSVAVDGVCLTVTAFGSREFSVGVQPETLRRTTLSSARKGRRVNLERALPANGRLGGHFVQGHVDGTAGIIRRSEDGNAVVLHLRTTPDIARYVVEKGFVAIDGASLTVVSVDSSTFSLSLVPFTRDHVTLANRRVGDEVNVEVDILAKYVERFVSSPRSSGVSSEFLAEHGFM